MIHKLKVPVEEYTSPSPISVAPTDPISQVVKLMNRNRCRHILVMDQEQLAGIISERDIYRSCFGVEDIESMLAQDVMIEDVFVVSKQKNIDEVVFTMSDRKIGSAVVYDKSDDSYGIFTSTDALNALVEIIRGDTDL